MPVLAEGVASQALTIDAVHASRELGDLVLALEKMPAVLEEKQQAFDAVYEHGACGRRRTQYGTRVYRKWQKWHDNVRHQGWYYLEVYFVRIAERLMGSP